MAKKKKRTRAAGRDARDGKFIPLSVTKRRPSTTVREQIAVRGGKGSRSVASKYWFDSEVHRWKRRK